MISMILSLCCLKEKKIATESLTFSAEFGMKQIQMFEGGISEILMIYTGYSLVYAFNFNTDPCCETSEASV